MTPELAGRRLYLLRRAFDGATLCLSRHVDAIEGREVIGGARNLIGYRAHDVDYYAWEAVRIWKIASKTSKAVADESIIDALSHLDLVTPGLKDYRDAATHPEDNRGNDDLVLASGAYRIHPGGRAEKVLDPTHAHEALRRLFSATETVLLRVRGSDYP